MTNKKMRRIYARELKKLEFERWDSNVSLVNVMPDEYMELEEIILYVEEWLDDNCSNGHFSRWTDRGDSIIFQADNFVERLRKLYNDDDRPQGN